MWTFLTFWFFECVFAASFTFVCSSVILRRSVMDVDDILRSLKNSQFSLSLFCFGFGPLF